MLDMILTIGIVLLIIVIIVLILSVFANITLGTPTPINALVKPISNKLGELTAERDLVKSVKKIGSKQAKKVKTYELSKEHEKTHEHEAKEHVHTREQVYEEPSLTKEEGKVKKLEK